MCTAGTGCPHVPRTITLQCYSHSLGVFFHLGGTGKAD